MILSKEAILPSVGQGVKFISPVTIEIKPADRGMWCHVASTEGIVRRVVGVAMKVEGRVPQRPTVCDIVQQSQGKNIWVQTRRSIVCVRSSCRICHWL